MRIKKGDKIMFLENYGDFENGDIITALSDCSAPTSGSTDDKYRLVQIKEVDDINGYYKVFVSRLKKVTLDNEINRILYPELKPDGKGHLI
jgi:hypothetical protein